MMEVKYNCGCVKIVEEGNTTIYCCDKHKPLDQAELLDALSKEYNKLTCL